MGIALPSAYFLADDAYLRLRLRKLRQLRKNARRSRPRCAGGLPCVRGGLRSGVWWCAASGAGGRWVAGRRSRQRTYSGELPAHAAASEGLRVLLRGQGVCAA